MSTTDWLIPGKRKRLELARTWMNIFNEDARNEKGEAVKKYQLWLIPQEVVFELGELFSAAETALALSDNPETRTVVVLQQVKTTSRNLERHMRMIKRRFGHIPPMEIADFVALGYRVPDKTLTPMGPSRTVPHGVVSYPLPHVIRLHIVPGDKSLYEKRSAALVCCRLGILDPAKEGRKYIKKVPTSADDLPEQEERRLQYEKFVFDADDAGKKVYFCMRYLNSKGEPGAWGPIIEAVIT